MLVWLWLSKPGIGPAISVFGVTISIVILILGIRSFIRQGQRWAAEDARIGPRVLLLIDGTSRPDGWRHAVVQVTNRLNADLEILKIEAVRPKKLLLASLQTVGGAARAPLGSKPAKSLDIRKTLPPQSPSPINYNHTWSSGLLLRISGTPNKDEGDVVRIRFIMRETDYPHKKWEREASKMVPPIDQ
jgi:hypothetical protein